MKTAWLAVGYIGLFLGMSMMVTAGASAEEYRLPDGVRVYESTGSVSIDNRDVLHVYTNDSVEKVMDFYRETLGMAPVEGRRFYLGDWGGGELVEDANLRIEVASERKYASIRESDLFDPLRQEVDIARAMGAEGDGDRRYRQLKQKYAHLIRGWYPRVKVEKKLATCRQKADANSAAYKAGSESRSARMEELVRQGRMDEVAKMARRQTNASMAYHQAEAGRVHWEAWESCYRDLDRHDFQVRIVIDKIKGQFWPAGIGGRKGAAGRKSEKGAEGAQGAKGKLRDKGADMFKGVFGF